MQDFIKHAFCKDIRDFIPYNYELLKQIKFNKGIDKKDQEQINDMFYLSNKHTIFNFVFIVKDFNKLLEGLKDLNVNAGSQKYRGQLDSLGYRISMTDVYFRESMYNHIVRLSDNKFNKSELFSFNNIHINMGNIR
jgi:hypothetical protein